MSLPPPDANPPSSAPPGGGWAGVEVALETATGWRGKFSGRQGPCRMTVRASDIVIEYGGQLREPLELAPGGIAVAAVDLGPAKIDKGRAAGRFPILHRLSPTAVIPREEGIEGWIWTSAGGSALTSIGEEDLAPNVALIFLQPLGEEVVARVFEPSFLDALAKRSPLGSPTVFGVLLRVVEPDKARAALEKVGVLKPLTDREVPPTHRRHLPEDRPANPSVSGAQVASTRTSVPPPGAG